MFLIYAWALIVVPIGIVGIVVKSIANYLRDQGEARKRAEEQRERDRRWRELLADLEYRYPTLLSPDTTWGKEGRYR